MAILRFGVPRVGLDYRAREGAYGLLFRDGKLAVVRVGFQAPYYYDLPGGGIDPGETPEAAVVREFGEETGLIVRAAARLPIETSQYFFDGSDRPIDNLCHLFRLELTGEDARLKVEADHQLEWHDPLQTLTRLRHEAHAYGVLSALRGDVAV